MMQCETVSRGQWLRLVSDFVVPGHDGGVEYGVPLEIEFLGFALVFDVDLTTLKRAGQDEHHRRERPFNVRRTV
jgi:hypothetical protein